VETPVAKVYTFKYGEWGRGGGTTAGIATIEVTGSLIGNLSQNAIYTFTLSFMKGFVFLILALMSVINFILLCIYKCVRRNGTSYEIIVKTSDGATQWMY